MVPLLAGCSANRPPFNMASMEIEKVMKPPNIVAYAHALSSDTRVLILRMLGPDGLSVTDIASSTGLVSSTVCFHLGELARVGLVTKRRMGRNVLYRWSDMRLSLRVEKVQPTPIT
jgi:DNA-binding transcriptional ArsR family regulator